MAIPAVSSKCVSSRFVTISIGSTPLFGAREFYRRGGVGDERKGGRRGGKENEVKVRGGAMKIKVRCHGVSRTSAEKEGEKKRDGERRVIRGRRGRRGNEVSAGRGGEEEGARRNIGVSTRNEAAQ